MCNYSIIIPIHNEEKFIPDLLKALESFTKNDHEIIIVDDGSTDGSPSILKGNEQIKIIRINKNMGKGYALKLGLTKASNDKIVIYDGDLELDPADISKLMLLDKNSGRKFVMGYRFKSLNPLKSNFDWGNFMFTSFFNIIFKSNHKDILCCAKAFYKDDLKGIKLNSMGFDIDVELSFILTIINKKKPIPQIFINYKRRTMSDGKKLKVSDGWVILGRIIAMVKDL